MYHKALGGVVCSRVVGGSGRARASLLLHVEGLLAKRPGVLDPKLSKLAKDLIFGPIQLYYLRHKVHCDRGRISLTDFECGGRVDLS